MLPSRNHIASQIRQPSLWPAEHRALATQAAAHFANAARAHLPFPRCVEARCRGGFSSGVEARFLFLLPLDGRARGEASAEARFPFLLPLDGRARGEASVEARARFLFPRCVEARCRGGSSSGVEARFPFSLPLDGRVRGEAAGPCLAAIR